MKYFCDNVILDNLSEFGICTGGHGSGKTHTLFHTKYLTETYNIPSKSVYIENPCGLGGKGQFKEVYKYILSTSLGWEEITKICLCSKEIIFKIASEKIEKLPPEKRQEINRDDTKKDELRENIFKEIVGETSPVSFRNFLDLTNGNIEIQQELEKKPSHIICAKVLATIIKLATLRKIDGTPGRYGAFFIFVDQTEDIAKLGATIYLEQIVGWRTLIDEVEKSLGMLWALDGSAEDIYGLLSDAIQRRQTIIPEKLRLLEFEENEAYSFIIDLLNYFRENNAKVNETYPFDKEAIREIIIQSPSKAPSHLLTNFRAVFTKVARRDLIKSTKDIITKDIVLQLL